MKDKIVIVVNGGNVTGVYSNAPLDVEVILRDWDNINDANPVDGIPDDATLFDIDKLIDQAQLEADPLSGMSDEQFDLEYSYELY